MSLTIGGGQRFPSLVEAARAERELNWRAWEAEKERRASLNGNPEKARAAKAAKRAEALGHRAQRRTTHLSAQQRERIQALYRAGSTAMEVALEMRLSIWTVKAAVERSGLRGGKQQRAAQTQRGA